MKACVFPNAHSGHGREWAAAVLLSEHYGRGMYGGATAHRTMTRYPGVHNRNARQIL